MFGNLRSNARRMRKLLGSRLRGSSHCGVCGFIGRPDHHPAMWPELVAEWQLNAEWASWFDQREGSHCVRCGSNLRVSQLAEGIITTVNESLGSKAASLRSLFRDPRALALSIAELNSAGAVHQYLALAPGLRHSEYGSTSGDVPSEDLMHLSYADETFDLVVTSDTLEHVPDIDIALRESLRILKPGGTHVFSVPVVSDRATRQRATFSNGHLCNLLPPSYHGVPAEGKTDYLVFYEFGADFVQRCEAAGFDVRLIRHSTNPALVTFIARKPIEQATDVTCH
jgi:SAM-dependent methyltransferase